MRSRGSYLAVVVAVLALAAAVLFFGLTRYRAGEKAALSALPAGISTRASAAPAEAPARPREAASTTRAPLRLPAGSADPDDSLASGAFEGRVVSWATGRGVSGAAVSFAHDGQTSTAVAGGDGSFRFVPQEPGLYEIAMVTGEAYLPFAPAFGDSPLTLTARAGELIRDIRIYLEPAVEYAGVVRSPAGEPVQGASVRLFDADGGEVRTAPLPDRFTSDERGEFRFSAPDEAILEARHPGFSPGWASVDLLAQAGRRVTIKLGPMANPARPGGTIAGRVLDAKGAPVFGARVRATGEPPPIATIDRTQRPRPESVSDEHGRFSLSDLEESHYDVLATYEGLAPVRAAGVRLGTQDLTLTLTAGAALRGTVREEKGGAPVAAFTIVVWMRTGSLERDIFATSAVFDAQGHYEVSGLPAGDYAVMAAAQGYAASAEAPFSVPDPPADPRPVDIALPRGGRVKGTVIEEGTARALEGARVSLEGRAGAGAWAAPVLASITTDAAGRFELQGIGAGLQSIMVVAEGHHGRIVSGLAVAEGGDVGPVLVELRKTEAGEEPRIELTGIGAVLSAKGDALMIGQVLEGGGALEAGLAAGDAIVGVDGAAVSDIGFEGAVQRIRGPEGSRVTLAVRRAAGGDPVLISVPRRRIHR